jgi:DNA-binding response OmpR family regulator
MKSDIGEGLSVFILEDEHDICDFTKEFIAKRGFKVETAYTAKTGMELVKEFKPDIALLDIHLGQSELNGLDVLRFIREEIPGCLCIMVTYDDNDDNIQAAKAAGVFDFLAKPLNTQNVNKVLERVVKEFK